MYSYCRIFDLITLVGISWVGRRHLKSFMGVLFFLGHLCILGAFVVSRIWRDKVGSRTKKCVFVETKKSWHLYELTLTKLLQPQLRMNRATKCIFVETKKNIFVETKKCIFVIAHWLEWSTLTHWLIVVDCYFS